jgi:hypothetical protein
MFHLHLNRGLTVAASAALIAGAAASPAYAAGTTPLRQAVLQLQPSTDLTFNEGLDSPTQDRQGLKVLVGNAEAREQAIARVSRIPAIPSQRAAKAEYLNAMREGIRFDVMCAGAVYTILDGHSAAGQRELRSKAFSDVQFRLNQLTSRAEQALGI